MRLSIRAFPSRLGVEEGMMLRDYFAAHALALMASQNDYPDAARVAQEAYAVADAMMAERDK